MPILDTTTQPSLHPVVQCAFAEEWLVHVNYKLQLTGATNPWDMLYNLKHSRPGEDYCTTGNTSGMEPLYNDVWQVNVWQEQAFSDQRLTIITCRLEYRFGDLRVHWAYLALSARRRFEASEGEALPCICDWPSCRSKTSAATTYIQQKWLKTACGPLNQAPLLFVAKINLPIVFEYQL